MGLGVSEVVGEAPAHEIDVLLSCLGSTQRSRDAAVVDLPPGVGAVELGGAIFVGGPQLVLVEREGADEALSWEKQPELDLVLRLGASARPVAALVISEAFEGAPREFHAVWIDKRESWRPLEMTKLGERLGDLEVAVAGVDLDVASWVVGDEPVLQLLGLGGSLGVAQPRKATGLVRLERDAGRGVGLLARQPVDPKSLARKRIEVHELRTFAGGRQKERGEIIVEDGELQPGPIAPRPTLMLAHANCSVGDSGISSQVRPSSRRPPLFGRCPPHCLKKYAPPSSVQRSRRSRSHSILTGRCLGPDSPPEMSQSMPVRSSPSSGPSNGSAEMNRTAASTSRR